MPLALAALWLYAAGACADARVPDVGAIAADKGQAPLSAPVAVPPFPAAQSSAGTAAPGTLTLDAALALATERSPALAAARVQQRAVDGICRERVERGLDIEAAGVDMLRGTLQI